MSGSMLDQARAALRRVASAKDAAFAQGFFRTGPGGYGEGDVFLGIRVPDVRQVAREHAGLDEGGLIALLRSRFHEERLLGLILLVRRYERGKTADRDHVYAIFLRERAAANNWDLVDTSAPQIFGAHLLAHPELEPARVGFAASENLWERRIAMVSTFASIRAGDLRPVEDVAERLGADPHDLIHKAAGWMLREAGKRDESMLRAFLSRHKDVMPRTMLRYAIEKFSLEERKRWMTRS